MFPRSLLSFAWLLGLTWAGCLMAEEPAVKDSSQPQQRFSGCLLVDTPWADGDSFQVQFPNGRKEVIRLYAADCFETDATDETLVRRLHAQRAHFGLTKTVDAVRMGLQAKAFTADLLKQPFVVQTDWSIAPGRSGLKRYYGFVFTPDGKDLAAELISHGLARAHGLSRQMGNGVSASEYRDQLADLEQVASLNHVGAWSLIDPAALAEQRKEVRGEEATLKEEQAEAATAQLAVLRVNPNTASLTELESLPMVGPALAQKIIAGRPYATSEDLVKVSGTATARRSPRRRWCARRGP